MFTWQKEMTHLGVRGQQVLRLFRSLVDVQVALPGLPGQEATAYLCAFRTDRGVRVSVALDLHRSGRVAFFLNDAGILPAAALDGTLEAGLNFAESMGFMLGDLDIQLQDDAARETLWDSLPLSGETKLPAASPAAGASPANPSPPSPPLPPTARPAVRVEATESPPPPSSPPVVLPAPVAAASVSAAGPADELPPVAERQACRERFRDRLGRFLASF